MKNIWKWSPVQASETDLKFLESIISQFQLITFNATTGMSTIRLKKSCESRAQSSSCLGTPGRITRCLFSVKSTRKCSSIKRFFRPGAGGAECRRRRRRRWKGPPRDMRGGASTTPLSLPPDAGALRTAVVSAKTTFFSGILPLAAVETAPCPLLLLEPELLVDRWKLERWDLTTSIGPRSIIVLLLCQKRDLEEDLRNLPLMLSEEALHAMRNRLCSWSLRCRDRVSFPRHTKRLPHDYRLQVLVMLFVGSKFDKRW